MQTGTRLRRAAAPLAALAALTAGAACADFACPDQLDVQQRAAAPAGWTVSYSEVPPRYAKHEYRPRQNE